MDQRKLYQLRHKENKTEVEETLLKYRESLSLICEILVSESKEHISKEKALEEIRNCIQKTF